MACQRCTEQVQSRLPKDSHSAFVRGILFGVGGAIIGLILYSAFGIITGLEIGYVSLAVGWLVGKAMKKGSNGIGGRRYQIVAIALTYIAVSLSAIPIGISQALKERDSRPHVQQKSSSSTEKADIDDGSNGVNASAAPAAPANVQPKKSLAALAGTLLFVGLSSPFLELQEGFSGIIGLIILLVGIQIAWKMTGAPKLDIVGPFRVAASAPPADAAT
jgi:hypothetical protein